MCSRSRLSFDQRKVSLTRGKFFIFINVFSTSLTPLQGEQTVSRDYQFKICTFRYLKRQATLLLIRDVTEQLELQKAHQKIKTMKLLNTAVSNDLAGCIDKIKPLEIKMRLAIEKKDFQAAQKCQELTFEWLKLAENRASDLKNFSLVDSGSFASNEVEFVPNMAVKQIVSIVCQSLKREEATMKESYDPRLSQQCLGDVQRF